MSQKRSASLTTTSKKSSEVSRLAAEALVTMYKAPVNVQPDPYILALYEFAPPRPAVVKLEENLIRSPDLFSDASAHLSPTRVSDEEVVVVPSLESNYARLGFQSNLPWVSTPSDFEDGQRSPPIESSQEFRQVTPIRQQWLPPWTRLLDAPRSRTTRVCALASCFSWRSS